MSENDWNVSKPIDHSKIGSIPQKIRDVKSSAKIIFDKEHVTPATDNAGGQHLKGAARVYLSDALPTLDPEGNSLDTTATTDDGRIHVNTSASNELRVYIATAAGVSTGFEHVRVGRVKASEILDANTHGIKNVASGTQTGQVIHVGQVDTTALTGQLKIVEPATGAMFAVAVLDPPTEDGHLVSKKHLEAAVPLIAAVAKAWVAFNPNGTVVDSYNVTSVVRDAAGKYTITWDTDFADANYAVIASGEENYIIGARTGTIAAGSVEIWTSTHAGVTQDPTSNVFVVAFGTQ